MSTPTKTTRKRRSTRPMTQDLAGIDIASTIEAAELLWPKMDLHPGDPAPMLDIAHRIHTWAIDRDIANLSHLTGDPSAQLLADLTVEADTADDDSVRQLAHLTGADDLLQLVEEKKSERRHLTRNTLIALRGTALVARAQHDARRTERPADDSLAVGLPKLGARTSQKRRPLRDDEILLARLLVYIDISEHAPALPTLAYALVELGMSPMKATQATTDDVEEDPDDDTTSLRAPGNWNDRERHLVLPPFTRHVLSKLLPSLGPDTQFLAYTGTQPNTKEASASLSPTVSRHLARAGVSGPGITPRGLSLWRPDHLIRIHHDLPEAVEVRGSTVKRLLRELDYVTDERLLNKNKIILRDHVGNEIATVPSKHVGELTDR